jgi:hypothetical protein
MKYLLSVMLIMLTVNVVTVQAQSIVGTWQQVDVKTCMQTELKESATEKELLPSMGATTKTSVAKLIRFDAKGRGQEGIFSQGDKKGDHMNDFQYKIIGQELQLLDKKSGIITQRFIIDNLGDSDLAFHNAMKDCESRTFTRVK